MHHRHNLTEPFSTRLIQSHVHQLLLQSLTHSSSYPTCIVATRTPTSFQGGCGYFLIPKHMKMIQQVPWLDGTMRSIWQQSTTSPSSFSSRLWTYHHYRHRTFPISSTLCSQSSTPMTPLQRLFLMLSQRLAALQRRTCSRSVVSLREAREVLQVDPQQCVHVQQSSFSSLSLHRRYST